MIDSINEIQLYLGLGLTTDQIRDIIICQYPEKQKHKDENVYCEELLQMYQARMHEVDQQLAALTEAKKKLDGKIHSMLKQREEERE